VHPDHSVHWPFADRALLRDSFGEYLAINSTSIVSVLVLITSIDHSEQRSCDISTPKQENNNINKAHMATNGCKQGVN